MSFPYLHLEDLCDWGGVASTASDTSLTCLAASWRHSGCKQNSIQSASSVEHYRTISLSTQCRWQQLNTKCCRLGQPKLQIRSMVIAWCMVHHMKNTRVLPHAIEDVRGNCLGPQHPKTCKVFYKKEDGTWQQHATTSNFTFLPNRGGHYILPTQTMHYTNLYMHHSRRNPSKLPHICILWSLQMGNLMTPAKTCHQTSWWLNPPIWNILIKHSQIGYTWIMKPQGLGWT